jgi:hypothetical protein
MWFGRIGCCVAMRKSRDDKLRMDTNRFGSLGRIRNQMAAVLEGASWIVRAREC